MLISHAATHVRKSCIALNDKYIYYAKKCTAHEFHRRNPQTQAHRHNVHSATQKVSIDTVSLCENAYKYNPNKRCARSKPQILLGSLRTKRFCLLPNFRHDRIVSAKAQSRNHRLPKQTFLQCKAVISVYRPCHTNCHCIGNALTVFCHFLLRDTPLHI